METLEEYAENYENVRRELSDNEGNIEVLWKVIAAADKLSAQILDI